MKEEFSGATKRYHRHSIRLHGYDYSQEGLYFVTICVNNRICLFGEIVDNKMIKNGIGEIVFDCWNRIPHHFPNVELHEFCVMPNHLHGIIEIIESANVGAKNLLPLQKGTCKTIGSIVRGFKIGVTKQIGKSVWQRNYYEHVIRNEQSYNEIVEYIENNPTNWNVDDDI